MVLNEIFNSVHGEHVVVTVLLKKARSRICGLAIIDRMRDFVGSYWHVPMPWAQGGRAFKSPHPGQIPALRQQQGQPRVP